MGWGPQYKFEEVESGGERANKGVVATPDKEGDGAQAIMLSVCLRLFI